MRQLLAFLLSACTLWTVLPDHLWAQQEQSIQTEGCGTVIGADVAQARDEALIAARVKAVESVATVHVDADTLVQNEMLLDAVVRTRATGLIKADRVLSEDRRSNGTLCVRIEAWVVPGAVQEKLPELISELSVVVLLAETNMSASNATGIVEGEVVQRLVEAGYRVFDPQRVQQLRRREIGEAARRGDQVAVSVFSHPPAVLPRRPPYSAHAPRRGDQEEVRRIGLRFLANIIVAGEVRAEFSQNNAGIVSAHARGELRVIETDTGRIIGSVARQGVRGFALSDDQAGRKALAEFGSQAVRGVLGQLDEHFRRKDRTIEVAIRGLADEAALARFKGFLQALRWVQDVQEQRFAPGESILRLTYPEKTVYLASRIAREPGFQVAHFDRNRVVVDVRR